MSLVLALVLTPAARRLALRVGALDPVGQRSVHQEPKPYLGGLAIAVAFVAAVVLVSWPLDWGLVGILVCGGLMAAIGLVDDLRRPVGIRAGLKFLLQIGVAALVIFAFDVRIEFMRYDALRNVFGLESGSGYIYFGAWAVPLTLFWLVAFTNVINLVDGLDGLAAGISTIGALTLMVVALSQGQPETMVLTAALAGAAIGFLRYNFNPAKIFMGDAGSMFLGFTLGAVAVHGVLKSAATVGVLVPILALGLPILDTGFAIVRRLLSGRSIGEADRDHLHHRLLRLGLSHRNAVLVMWAVSAWLGLSAVVVTELQTAQALGIVVAVIALVGYGGLRLGLLGADTARHRRSLDQ